MTVLTKTTHTVALDDETTLVATHRAGKLRLERKGLDNRDMPVILTQRDAERLGIVLCKFLKACE